VAKEYPWPPPPGKKAIIMDQDFDIDVTFEESANESLIASLSKADLKKRCDSLPHELVEAATAILVDKRTYSDVSQALGIRQPELVRAIHRAKLIISGDK
jgi:DNA-directed RNA polymerase specialized sigma24 family protein